MKNWFSAIWVLILSLLIHDSLSIKTTTEKITYHSAELMNLSLEIFSNEKTLATVSVKGINNKLNMQKEIELVTGKNFINFEYNLPRCNVCGGIKPGNYTITSIVKTNKNDANNTLLIEIIQ